MKHLTTYKIFESKKRGYTKQDQIDLSELVKDIDIIMLDIADEYGLTSISSTMPEEDDHYELPKSKDSYVIRSEVKYSRHGAYGMVTIKINCYSLLSELEKELYYIDDLKGPLRELLNRLNTIGHCEYISLEYGDIISIQVIPR